MKTALDMSGSTEIETAGTPMARAGLRSVPTTSHAGLPGGLDGALLAPRDWALLGGGAIFIVVFVLGGVELALTFAGRQEAGSVRWVLLARGAVTALLLGGWTLWAALHCRRRMERTRETLREQALALADRARRAEQAAGLAALSRQLAHEIRNPLHAILLHCRLLRRQVESVPADLRDRMTGPLDLLEEEADLIDRLVDEHQRHLRAAPPILHLSRVDLRALISDELARHGHALAQAGVRVENSAPRKLPELRGDEMLLRQLAHQLIEDALENARPEETVVIDIESEGSTVVLTLTANNQETRADGGDSAGSVLRQAIVRDVARVHGGEYAIAVERDGSRRTSVRLPVGNP